MHAPAFSECVCVYVCLWVAVDISFRLASLYLFLGDSLWFLWRTSFLPVVLLGALFMGPLPTSRRGWMNLAERCQVLLET